MTTAAEFLNYAKECMDWAKDAATEEQRRACLALARQWTEAALALNGAIKPEEPATDKSTLSD
jgi:hypothetical protein